IAMYSALAEFMNRATHGRVEFDAGLIPRNFIVNLMGFASFHSSSPTVPSITGVAVQEAAVTVLGSSGSWARSRLRKRVKVMDWSTGRAISRFQFGFV